MKYTQTRKKSYADLLSHVCISVVLVVVVFVFYRFRFWLSLIGIKRKFVYNEPVLIHSYRTIWCMRVIVFCCCLRVQLQGSNVLNLILTTWHFYQRISTYWPKKSIVKIVYCFHNAPALNHITNFHMVNIMSKFILGQNVWQRKKSNNNNNNCSIMIIQFHSVELDCCFDAFSASFFVGVFFNSMSNHRVNIARKHFTNCIFCLYFFFLQIILILRCLRVSSIKCV